MTAARLVCRDLDHARAMIEAVAEWLESYDPPPPSGRGSRSETKNAKVAREFADEILSASTADGWGGCPLCKG